MNTTSSVEQAVAEALFIKSGLVLAGEKVGDEYVGFEVEVRGKRNTGRSFFAGRGPLKVVVTVGGWNDKKVTYRERTNGTFNIDKIAERLISKHDAKIATRKRTTENTNNRANAAEQRRLALSLLGGERSEYSSTVEVTRYNQLSSKIVLKATSENAEKLAKVLAYAEELGIAV